MPWQFWIDRGGTFTDIVARAPAGDIVTRKLLSESSAYPDAALAGIRDVLAEREGLAPGAPLPADRIDVVKIGTTIATNALLTRTGAPTVLAITEGFADALRIGTQARPRLFDLAIRLPDMLYSAVIEVKERLAADGTVERALDEAGVRAALAAKRAEGFTAVGVVLMHGYRYSAHEARVAAIAREVGFTQVSASHAVSPLVKLVARGDTTVADAYLSPALKAYTARLAQSCPARLLFMQSNGGLATAQAFSGKDAILSGPAGGVVGAAETAAAAGFDRVIGFDMGGTSTDVCLVADQNYERSFETTVAGVRLRTPMMRVHTVAAGGGSILAFDGLRFRAGPASAGAAPGPACYGKGGPLTITDANLLLGRIQPAFFPKVFGDGAQALDAEAVRAKFAALAADVAAAQGRPCTPEELALGFTALAVDNMARAIRKISIERGHDVAGYVLACFGGAGGQHACAVADALGMDRVYIHPLAGVLSAFGIGLARIRAVKTRTVERPLDDPTVGEVFAALEREARSAVESQGVPADTVVKRMHVKYAGTDATLMVPFGPTMSADFIAAHQAQFGFVMERSLVCDMAEVEAVGPAEAPVLPPALEAATPVPPAAIIALTTASGAVQAPLFLRDDLARGQEIAGPAVIAERLATTVVDAGWTTRVDGAGGLVLTRTAKRAAAQVADAGVDPMRVELFNNLFMSIAEQMGAALQNTAQSVNIKERLDFSCALFDAKGQLLANAPHMPVHLGSMGESVRVVIEGHHATWRPGDTFVLNNPYAGGTHLPDITVVTPVFLGGDTPRFFVASRGHHADIGGATPGSMPPASRTLAEEGILLDNLLLVRGGVFQDDAIRAVLAAGPMPARAIDTNLADLRAQVAANAKGAAELARAVAEHGPALAAYAGHVLDHAEEAVRRLIGGLTDGAFTAPMDDGGHITVKVTIDHAARAAVVDFAGTSAQRPTNFNAPAAVCRAAVLYVFRTLIADEIPMNEGVLRPITLKIPEGSMLRPQAPAAVVAGNVETSQIMCDALYGALGVLAASQGTMNNFTFGNDTHQYYETIAGGAGAGSGFDGASAVQTHMTNSRLTDPEVLENRFPVTVERFAVRSGSGGNGKYRGGDGAERRIRFNAPMTAAILSGRRASKPFGLKGGEDAAPGETRVYRRDGRSEILGATDEVRLAPGEAITILTPGGGGYGDAES